MPPRWRWLPLLLCVAWLVPSDIAEEPAPLMTVLDDARVLVAGRIVVQRAERTVILPAVVNQHRGLVEYLLVHATGKRHESLFSTMVSPLHMHLACLLAGAPETGAAPMPVQVDVRWQTNGPTISEAAERFLLPATHEAQPVPGASAMPAAWAYGGSRFSADGFAAKMEGSCIALQADPAALVQAPGLSGEFIPDASRLPPIGSPVSIVLTFPSPAATQTTKESP